MLFEMAQREMRSEWSKGNAPEALRMNSRLHQLFSQEIAARGNIMATLLVDVLITSLGEVAIIDDDSLSDAEMVLEVRPLPLKYVGKVDMTVRILAD